MLVRAPAEDVNSFQAYTIRHLDQKQSTMPDTEHYKLIDVEENAMSNKLKHLDVLCFHFQVEGLVRHTNIQFPFHHVSMLSHTC